MHFQFNGKLYRQVDGVEMGSPIGIILTNIFIVEFGSSLVLTMQEEIALWLRYVDDTSTLVKRGCKDQALAKLAK